MFVLVEYNNNYENSIREVVKCNLVAVTLFKIILSDKQKNTEQLEKIKQLKLEIKPKYSAIQIKLEKIDNSTVGIISNLKQQFDVVIGLGGLNKINRYFLEQTTVDFLQDAQNSSYQNKFDFIHHFNSGLNHILCKFAKEKNTDFIFSLNFTREFNKYNLAKEFGRINQNLKFARKYKIKSIVNFIIQRPQDVKSIEEIKGILSLFDISTIQSSDSINILEDKVKLNQFKKSDRYITEGIEIIN